MIRSLDDGPASEERKTGDLPVLRTRRLSLRKLTLDDVADFYEYASNPEVSRFLGWEAHRSREESQAFISDIRRRYAQGLVAPWGIELSATKKLIGTCGFVYVMPWQGRGEIGYALARPYWGQGFMPEAVAAALRYGFERLALNRIEARCDVANSASERVMQKVGMQPEGVLRQFAFIKGRYRDMKLYAILRADWQRDITTLPI